MDHNKLELAKHLANQSKRISGQYDRFVQKIIHFIHYASTGIDRVLFNAKYAKVVSLILAALLYIVVNYNDITSLYQTSLKTSRTVQNVAVYVQYDTQEYEISGIPTTTDVTITGDATSVTAASTTNGKVVADLTNLSEGTHAVTLIAEGFGDSVSTIVNPSNAVVTIKKKVTQQFAISYDIIHRDKMDGIYNVGTPQFASSVVDIRASQDTLNQIAFVKALIDVSNQVTDFEQDAKLVAYDANGQIVNVDIEPQTMHVYVPVTSPNKTVPIEVKIKGTPGDNQAVASAVADKQTVTIYGTESALLDVDKITVEVDVSNLIKDTTVSQDITLPTGITSATVSTISVDVKFGAGTTKTITGVPINYKNNIHNYKATQSDNITTMDVEVFGTQDNISKISANDIYLYIDMSTAEPGLHEFEVKVEQSTTGLVKYSLKDNKLIAVFPQLIGKIDGILNKYGKIKDNASTELARIRRELASTMGNISRSLNSILRFSKQGKNKIVIGKDTRLSSDMFENALAAGITSEGCDAYLAGYCPTPMICLLTKENGFACGAMISASHNPFYDNGIKVFSNDGFKLSGDIEGLIEDYIDGKVTIPYRTDSEIGKVIAYPQGIEIYLDWIVKEYPLDLSGWKIAIDCANGSSSYTAKKALERLGAEVTAFHNEPNGININTKCGSTHPELFCEEMRKGNYTVGLTFDGDADRQIMVRPDGELVNGDFMLYIVGKYLRDQNKLTNNTIVTTVMANLGLYKAMEREGIRVEKTQVGDKYVSEVMFRDNYVIGGEQSGHIILKEHATTGDGLLTALSVLEVMKNTGKSIIELCGGLKIYPQLLVNVKVTDKTLVMDDKEVQKSIDEVNEELNGNGRILVRPSGTEPLLRVMAEAETDKICERLVGKVADIIRRKYGA